jgi:hypothetical protein
MIRAPEHKAPHFRESIESENVWDGRTGRPATAEAPKTVEVQPARSVKETCGPADSAGS